MRVLVPLLLVAGSAGCLTPPCPAEDCIGVCVASAPQARDVVIDAFTVAQLGPLLTNLREGLVVSLDDAVFCEGEVECRRRLPATTEALPDGTWHLEVPYRQPVLAQPSDWTATLATQCIEGIPDELGEVEQRDAELVGTVLETDERGRGVLRGAPVVSPSAGSARACAWRVTFKAADLPDRVVEGRFTIRAAERGEVLTPDVTSEPAAADPPGEPEAPAPVAPASPGE